MPYTIRHATDDDREPMFHLAQQAFAPSPAPWDDQAQALDQSGHPLDRRRVASDGDDAGDLAGMASVWELGQFFGGRKVPMGGVGSVAVPPHHRGSGLATRLMRTLIDDMRERGEVISTLYPMNHELYRSLGWSSAGEYPQHRWEADALATLPRPRREVTVRPTTADDLDALNAINDEVAEAGNLSYGPRFRPRRLLGMAGKQEAYVTEIDGVVTGGLTLAKEAPREDAEFYGLDIRWLSAIDHDSELALWRLIASHVPAARTVSVVGPLRSLLPHAAARRANSQSGQGWVWMTRLIDAVGAVTARGFAEEVTADVHLDVVDELAPWNAGAHVLRIRDGRGRLEPGGTGAVRVGIGALASIYTGWADPTVLRRWGMVDGPTDQVAALGRAFAGPTPWARDFF